MDEYLSQKLPHNPRVFHITELTRRSVDLDVTEVQHVCRHHLDGHELTADVIAARQRLARRLREAGRLLDAHLVRVEV